MDKEPMSAEQRIRMEKLIKGMPVLELGQRPEDALYWGCNYEEFESGPGNYTIAIIERADGTVEKVIPEWITFTDKESPNEN